MTTARDLAYAVFVNAGGWQRDHFEHALDVYDEERAIAWERGYHRGVRDELQDLEPADNPYRKEDADG